MSVLARTYFHDEAAAFAVIPDQHVGFGFKFDCLECGSPVGVDDPTEDQQAGSSLIQ